MDMATSNSMVTVLCRMPSGLVLDLYDDALLAARAGDARRGQGAMAPPVPRASVRLAGARRDPRYHPRDNRLLGMAGRTEVPADFWSAWCAQNPDFAPLRHGLIAAERTADRATSWLREHGGTRTGLESLDPDALPVVGVTRRDAA